MTTLMQAHRQWASRPADEKFSSVADLHTAACGYRDEARTAREVPTNKLQVIAEDGDIYLESRNHRHPMTNWAFGQVARAGGAPASYLPTLPAELAADCLNHGLKATDSRDNALLFRTREDNMAELRALTSMRYSRIWNVDVTSRLVQLEQQGPWQPAPAAFDGSRGLYLGDRDMFAFMVDNDRRIFETGPGGGLSRGFFVRNSEVGAASFSVMTFFYNFVCGNHMVWGASGIREVKIRHVGDAFGKAFNELEAELIKYADSSASEDELRVEKARTYRIGKDLDEVLDVILGLKIPGLGKRVVTEGLELAKRREDWYGDPYSVWGLAGGITEIARDMPNADERTALETATGKMMEIAF